MGCGCGGSRRSDLVIVRYVGSRSTYSFTGESTGRKYWFRGNGAELRMDRSDFESMDNDQKRVIRAGRM
jgi:hypothetical protein